MVLKYYLGKSESHPNEQYLISIHTQVSKEQVEVHDRYIYMCVYTVHKGRLSAICKPTKVI